MEAPPQENPDIVDDMKTAEGALHVPVHLLAKARFVPGPSYHVQFDGGSQDGHGTGGFCGIGPQ